jgi:hypothetical protein
MPMIEMYSTAERDSGYITVVVYKSERTKFQQICRSCGSDMAMVKL